MVYYFTSNIVAPPAKIFMGLDKHENEELIRWGWPEDVWFHVDKKDQTIDDIPTQLLDDCAQLVKANSIQGNKMNNIKVVYTAWENLHKTGDMAVGQIGFHRQKDVRLISVEKRINEVVNRLNKTQVARSDVDFRAEREERDRKERENQKAIDRERRKQEQEEQKRKEEEKRLRSYDTLFNEDAMQSNKDGNDSDDFM